MREWVQRASHAASDESLQGAEAEGRAARPRRTMVASGGLASRALGDALAVSTLPPTWQPQPPPKSAEQVWFARETPAAAEAKVLVSDVADNCAASGLVRRGDRVRNISPGCSRMYPGLQPYAPCAQVLSINGVKVTDEQQGTVFACVDMGRHRVQTPQSAASVPDVQGLHKSPPCLPHAAEAQGSPLGRGGVRVIRASSEGQGGGWVTARVPCPYPHRCCLRYRGARAVPPQAVAKAAVGEVVTSSAASSSSPSPRTSRRRRRGSE